MESPDSGKGPRERTKSANRRIQMKSASLNAAKHQSMRFQATGTQYYDVKGDQLVADENQTAGDISVMEPGNLPKVKRVSFKKLEKLKMSMYHVKGAVSRQERKSIQRSVKKVHDITYKKDVVTIRPYFYQDQKNDSQKDLLLHINRYNELSQNSQEKPKKLRKVRMGSVDNTRIHRSFEMLPQHYNHKMLFNPLFPSSS